jgi:conjugal transfer ATP-binding protein TraC
LIERENNKSGEGLKKIGAFFGFGKKPKVKACILNEKKYLSDFLSYREIESESNIFINKSTYGFVLKLKPFSGIDSNDINALRKIVSYEIPSEAVVQVINYASPSIAPLVEKWCEVVEKPNSIYKTLTEKRKQFFLNGCNTGLWGKNSEVVLRNFEIYFCVSFNKEASVRSNSILLQKIIGVRAKISKAFSGIGCQVEHVSKHGLNNYLKEILLTKEEQLQKTDYSPNLINFPSNPEYIMHSNFAEVRNNISSKKFILFEVDEWPGSWEMLNGIDYIGSFESGRGIPFPFYISFGFRSEGTRESERKSTKMRVIRTNQTTAKLVSFVPAMREEMEDWHYITEEIDKGARLAKACMYVVALIDEEIDVDNAAQDILDHFYQLGFRLNQIKYDCLNNLLNTLAMQQAENWTSLRKNKGLTTMVTSSCLNLLPIFADAQNSNTPLMMLVGRRGQVFFFDNYSSVENGNYNMVVVGKSGSGKSVFLQEYMTSILRGQGQVVVIDDGRSFQNSTKILGGDFVDFKGMGLCINPFSLCFAESDLATQDYKEDFEEPLIELIVSILCIVTNIDKNNTKDFEIGLYKDVLKKAVQIVLEDKGNKGGFKDIYLVLKNDLRLRTSQTESIADKLAYVLKDYGDGRYAPYYNGKATLSIDNLLTVFELSSLESNEVLQTSVLLMVVFLVYTKMQGRERRTSLIIDEAWRLLRHDAIKGFIEGIARRARKYNGSLVVATQSISDFEKEKSAAAAAVLSQSDWRVLLSAENKDEKILKDQLGMHKGEIDIACSLKGDKGRFSEFMIRHSSGSWCIGRLMLEAFSVKLYSSKAEDVTQIQKLRKQGYSLEDAIEQLISEESHAR